MHHAGYQRVVDNFVNLFGYAPQWLSRAPGRINLIGEHTDYNDGLVLPAAISHSVYLAVSTTARPAVQIFSTELNQWTRFKNKTPLSSGLPPWGDYFRGILAEYPGESRLPDGLDIAIHSTIPIGSGLSSSAAIEAAFALALNEMCNLALTKWEIVRWCQRVENRFMDIQSGFMDQFASVFGQEGNAILLDCKSRNHRFVPVPDGPFEWVLIESGVKHRHASSGYNKRVDECRAALTEIRKFDPKIESIRDVNLDLLQNAGFQLSPLSLKRLRFLAEENRRVVDFEKEMKKGHFEKMGDILYRGHDGLQRDYEVSCPEVDCLVELTRPIEAVLGSRMMGGGFGGCTLNLVSSSEVSNVFEKIKPAYYRKTGLNARLIRVHLGAGAECISHNKLTP